MIEVSQVASATVAAPSAKTERRANIVLNEGTREFSWIFLTRKEASTRGAYRREDQEVQEPVARFFGSGIYFFSPPCSDQAGK